MQKVLSVHISENWELRFRQGVLRFEQGVSLHQFCGMFKMHDMQDT